MKKELFNQNDLTSRLRQLLVIFTLLMLPIGAWAQTEYYDLWIKSNSVTLQVTSDNSGDLVTAFNNAFAGTGASVSSGTFKFDPNKNQLIFEGVTINDNGTAFHIESGLDKLTIHFKGTNSISTSATAAIYPSAGKNDAELVFEGEMDGTNHSTIYIHGGYFPISDFNKVTYNTETFLESTYAVYYGDDGFGNKIFLYEDHQTYPSSLTFTTEAKFPLWVADTQVDADNMGDVFGDATVSYEPTHNTLTMNGISLVTAYSGNYIVSNMPSLKIDLHAPNIIYCTGAAIKNLYTDASLDFKTTDTDLAYLNVNTGKLYDGFSDSKVAYEEGLEYDLTSDPNYVGEIYYNLRVGHEDKFVMYKNKDNFTVDDGSITFGPNGGKVSYDPTIHTLTIENATITGCGIKWEEDANLTIKLIGTNSITTNGILNCIKAENQNTPPSLTFEKGDNSNVCSLELNCDAGTNVIGGFSNSLTPNTTGVYWTPTTDNAGAKSSATVSTTLSYPLYIGNTQVTSDNANDVLNNGGKVKFSTEAGANNTTTYKLTLTDVTITTPVKIGLSNLTFDIQGSNTISTSETCLQVYGTLASSPHLTFKSTSDEVGDLTLTCTTEYTGVSDIGGGNVTISNELVPVLMNYGNYTSNMYVFNNGGCSEAMFVPSYGVKVGDLYVYSGNTTDVLGENTTEPTVTFDKVTNTLTLNKASGISNISTSLTTLNIDLVGNNSLFLGSNGYIFESENGADVTINVKSSGATKGSLTLGTTSSNPYARFKDDHVTLTPINPLAIISGDLTTNKGTLVIGEVYGITVDGVAVNATNVTNILANDPTNDGKVSFTPDDGTNGNILTLNGATLTSGIVSGLDNLTIHLQGENVIKGTSAQALATAVSSTVSTAPLTFTSELGANNAPTGKLLFPYVDISITGFASCTYNSGLDFISRGVSYTPPEGASGPINVDAVTEVTYFRVGGDAITSANYTTKEITPAEGSGTISFSYVSNTPTLTLNGVNTDLAINSYLEKDLTVAIKGTNVINTTTTYTTCICSNISKIITFTKGDNNDCSLTLICPDGNDAILGFSNYYLPNLGAGLVRIAPSQSSQIFTTDPQIIVVNGNLMTSGQSAPGATGSVSYNVTGSEKILTFENFYGTFATNNAIETGVTGLKVKLIGNNYITCQSDDTYAFKSLQSNASIEFVRVEGGSLTMKTSNTTNATDGFTAGNVTYNGLICYESGDHQWSVKRPSKPSLQTTQTVTGGNTYTYATIDYATADKSATSNNVLYSAQSPTLKYSFDCVDASLTVTNQDYPANGIQMTSPGVLTAWVEVGTVKSEEVTGVRFGLTEDVIKAAYNGAASQTISMGLQPAGKLDDVDISLLNNPTWIASFNQSNKELTVTSCGMSNFSLAFTPKKTNNTPFTTLGDDGDNVKFAIEVLPPAPTIDGSNVTIDTDNIGITSSVGGTTIFYTWDSATIGKSYTHSADASILTVYNDTGVPARNGTLRAWVGYSTGNNNFVMSDEVSQVFTGVKTNIAGYYVADIASQTYTGSAWTPAVTVKVSETAAQTLTAGTDYTVSYQQGGNNVTSLVNAGTYNVIITGTGNYGGDITSKTFTINQADLKDAVITPIVDQTYTGSGIEPVLSVEFNGLAVATDEYIVSYENNINAGTATVKVKATGKNFTKDTEAVANFTIKNKVLSASDVFTGGKQYVHYYSTEDLDLGAGIAVYVITDVTGNTAVTRELRYVPKNVPVLLGSISGSSTATETSADGNMLSYTTADITLPKATGTAYMLYENMYVRVTGNELPAGKTYLWVPAGKASNARQLSIGHDDDATGIESAKVSDENGQDIWFDMQGRRINRPTKDGLYIKNGKKTVINQQ